jgi:hypothetical protein
MGTLNDKIETNTWEGTEQLKDLFDFILKVATDCPLSERYKRGWDWTKNFDCKYIDIRIDMRDGGFILRNREGKRIELKDLKHQ